MEPRGWSHSKPAAAFASLYLRRVFTFDSTFTSLSLSPNFVTGPQIQDRNKAIWDSEQYHHDYIFWYVNGKLRKSSRR